MAQNKYYLPTGVLFTDDYSKGQLETLSIGDYGKRYNVKADFLGYSNEINGVPNTMCMPLSEKWVITVSTQFGCAMKCTFCSVPNVKWAGNASFEDIKKQFYSAIGLFPNVKYVERLNLHFARMGEPIFNPALFEGERDIIKAVLRKTSHDEYFETLEAAKNFLAPLLQEEIEKTKEKLQDLERGVRFFKFREHKKLDKSDFLELFDA